MNQSVGVYIGRKQVVACLAALKKGVPQVKAIAIEAFPEEGELQKTAKIPKKIKTREGLAVHRALEKLGQQGKSITLAFSSSQMVTRYFEMPQIPEKEKDKAVRYEATRYLPFKTEDTVSDFKAHPKPEKTDLLAVTYTSAKKEIIQQYLDYASQGSAKANAIDPHFAAFARVLAGNPNVNNPTASYGLAHIDSDENVNITLVHQQSVILSHDFFLGGDLISSQSRFSQEVKGSFEYLYRMSGQKNVSHIYLSGIGDLELWKNYLNEYFKGEVAVEIVSVNSEKPMESALLNTATIAYGLALRGLKRKSPLGDFSLLPTVKKSAAEDRLIKKVIIESLFFLILFGLLGFGASHQAGKLKMRLSAGTQDLQLMLKSVPELEAIRDQMKSSRKLFRSFLEENELVRSKLMVIAKTKPRPVWIESLVYGTQINQINQRGQEKADRKASFVISGYCFLNNPHGEIQMLNKWANELSKNADFIQGTKKVKVSEIRFGTYQGKDTTIFQITTEPL